MKPTHAFRRNRAGFVLPMAVVLLATVGIMLGTLFGYIGHVARTVSRQEAATVCRLTAQTSIEDAKRRIYASFLDYFKARGTDPFLNVIDSYFSTARGNAIGPTGYVVAYPKIFDGNNCRISLQFTSAESVSMAQLYRELRIRAKVSCKTTLGEDVSRTLQETVVFALEQSRVFDYAYFVNNYGWFQGGGGIANGDIRANGNLLLDSQCYVNGAMYAARNPLFGVAGDITGGTGRCYAAQSYLYNSDGRWRPLESYAGGGDSKEDLHWTMGYDPGIRSDPEKGYGTFEGADILEMPYLGDLENYKKLAKGTVSSPGSGVTVNEIHDRKQSGPSGNPALPDAGSVLLVGTWDNPIRLNGTVVVEGDVIIKGYVAGQGAIYAGRNIHILGDLRYKNPPNWNTGSSQTQDSLEAQAEKNAKKDLLVLAAKGNVVLGNYTSRSWLESVNYYISPSFVKPYACDPSDADIGYKGTFNGDYRKTDGGSQVVYDRRSDSYKASSERKYYESSVADNIIQSNSSSSDIRNVDAVIYNNHAVMGNIGSCSFNGAVVCRDEALLYDRRIAFNWDIRLGSRSIDNRKLREIGAINASNIVQLPMTPQYPRLTEWCEILQEDD